MATLILGTVGRAIGGPIGGIAGTLLGGSLDRAIFGSGKPREGPRLANLGVQSAAYGEPLPRIYGRMRVAGNLVWTAGIKEIRTRNGGGKGGPATNSYSYSSSFAVIVSARAIVGVERIWADGKLLRAADGTLNFPATIRVVHGGEAQAADPLIAAAEGSGLTPAYRGRAIVVFEDLPLADYGNRIPNLTFEVVSDAEPVGIDAIAADIAGLTSSGGPFPAVTGFAVQAGTVRQALQSLTEVGALTIHDDGIALTTGAGGAALNVTGVDSGASDRAVHAPELSVIQAADASVPDAVWLSYSDPTRDYQASVQAARRRTPALRIEHRELAVAMAAEDAKALTGRTLRDLIAARTTGRLATSWRYAALRPGMMVVVGDDPIPWRVTHRTITGAIAEFDLVRMASTPGSPAATDAGRAFSGGDAPQGTTILHVLDLPPLPGTLPSTPRLLLAAGGGHGWRRADVLVSRDGGESYTAATTIQVPAAIGVVRNSLSAATTDRWDRRSAIEVEMAADGDDLQSATEAAVLAGANLAAAGGEVVQFATVEALGNRCYRLTDLLRGRRGTEAAASTHVAGEAFVLLDERVVAFDLPVEAIGAPIVFKAAGPADDLAEQAAVSLTPRGAALRPLAPVHLKVLPADGGDRALTWVRRSRAGFAWSDGTDAPLAEDVERYQVTLRDGDRVIRQTIVAEARWTVPAADLVTGSVATAGLNIGVAQLSTAVGTGSEAIVAIAAV